MIIIMMLVGCPFFWKAYLLIENTLNSNRLMVGCHAVVAGPAQARPGAKRSRSRQARYRFHGGLFETPPKPGAARLMVSIDYGFFLESIFID